MSSWVVVAAAFAATETIVIMKQLLSSRLFPYLLGTTTTEPTVSCYCCHTRIFLDSKDTI